MKFLQTLSKAILLMLISALPVAAQNSRVDITKHSKAMPKSCELVLPAKIDDPVDIPALVKEAFCKGAGDMLGNYTYVTHSIKREKDKKGKEKQETYTYDVFFPTLKSGMRTRGIQVVTSHNGVPVSPDELQKERVRAAERIEKEEEKIADESPAPSKVSSIDTPGMLPIGMYAGMTITRQTLVKKSGARLAVHTFLKSCTLTLLRREPVAGREALIFSFAPRPDAQFADNEKYIAQLTGEIWIDAADRIVVRLVGWPTSVPAAKASKDINASVLGTSERPPAVHTEMMRLRSGIWLPRVNRINGADYPTLFDGITTDSTNTLSDYINFSTEVKDAKVAPPKQP